MMKTLMLTIFLVFSLARQAQEPKILTLNQLTDSALAAFPPGRGRQILEQSFELKKNIVRAGLYPNANLNAQLSYQSDVTKIEIPMPGFKAPELAKDWYRVNIDLYQTMYDGGMTKARLETENAEYQLQINKIEQAEEQLKKKVNDLFYGVLMANNRIRVLNFAIATTQAMISETDTRAKKGMVLKSELAAVESGLLQYKQQLVEASAARNASLELLSSLCNVTISASDSLSVNTPENNRPYTLNRKDADEFGLLTGRANSLMLMEKSKRRPALGLFGQAGYGRPGYNMLDDSFDEYFLIGIRLNYNIWDWNTHKRNIQVIRLQQKQTELAEENFRMLHMGRWKAMIREAEQFDSLLALDDEIIRLQQTVVDASRAQLNNGTITGAAFVTELNKLHQSIIMRENHKILRSKTYHEINLLTGNQ